ncbi:hypothetical protein JBL43_18890 [Aureibaculum sp. A20]|uniref:Vitellogenin domain-containing protein n=1 Tax=Aureibaculum flavum TaxID=2795986 RepID=A0ABS0WWE8_9FLAO|nr:hypothetical protein [Aureibaculum flavum]MBJ2176326.1 hypothetical protein [Aureibaculum flavum]
MINSSNQFNYIYNSENFGFNDINRLYSSDTVNAEKSFFESETLQDAEVTVRSNLTQTILKQDTEGKLVCYQLINPSFILKSGGLITDTKFISKELVKPVYVEMNNHGKIGLISTDSSMTEMAIGILKDIISRTQFVLPVEKAKSWRTTEENTNGTYTANYRILESNLKGRVYEKEIDKYLKYKSKRKNQNIYTDNKTTIETDDDDGIIKSINTSEAQVVLNNADTISASGTKLSIVLLSVVKVKKRAINEFLKNKTSSRYKNKTTISAPISSEKITKMVYAGILGSDNWQQLLQRLSAKSLTKKEEDVLIEKLSAMYYLEPETCKKAVFFLKNESFNATISKVLLKALSITETEGATNAMAQIIEINNTNEEVLEELLPALATTSKPTSEATDIIKSLAFEKKVTQNNFIKSTAQLTLGGMAKQFLKMDSLKAKTLTRYLIEEMKFEKDTIQHLLVLGNTGSTLILPFIKSLVESSQTSEKVKIEAVSALSLINYKQVSIYLKKMLKHKNVAIQNKAAEVIAFQKSSFVKIEN